MEHPINSLIDSAMSNIKSMVDVETVIGNAVTCEDGTIIIPISSVSFGFGAGGSDFSPKTADKDNLFGGGCGGGANIKPAGFLVVANGNVRYLPVTNSSTGLDKMMDLVPEMIDKVNNAFVKRNESKKPKKTDNIEIID